MAKRIQYSQQKYCFIIRVKGVGNPCSLSRIAHQERAKEESIRRFRRKNQQVKHHMGQQVVGGKLILRNWRHS